MLALGLSACGGTSADDLQKAREQGAKEQKQKHDAAEQKRKQRALEKKVARLERARRGGNSSAGSAGGGGTTTGSTSCGGGLSVNGNTSCTFAENVRAELNSVGGGSATINVYSPVTGATYTMRCTAGVTTICRGGNNATVYIR